MSAGRQIYANRLVGIDLLRFVAALLVVFAHFGLMSKFGPYHTRSADVEFPFLTYFRDFGGVGVNIFFVISGCVISATAIGSDWISFVKRRFIRIYPSLLLLGAMGAVLRLFWGEDQLYVAFSFMRQALLSPIGPWIDGVVWTLIVEVAFYAVIAISLAWRPEVNAKIKLEYIAKILGISSAIFVGFFFVSDLLNADWLISIISRFPFKVILLRHGIFFALGIFLWIVANNKSELRAKFPAIVLLSAFCVAEIFVELPAAPFAAIITWGACVLWIIYCLLSPVGHHNLKIGGLSSVFARLGAISYPLYLGHNTVGMCLIPLIARFFVNPVIAFGVALSIVVLLASLVAMKIEPVCQALLRRILIPLGR